MCTSNQGEKKQQFVSKPGRGLVLPARPSSTRPDFRVELLGHEMGHRAGRKEFKSVVKVCVFWLPDGSGYAGPSLS